MMSIALRRSIYQVEVPGADVASTQMLGENQIYLSELARTIHPHFNYSWSAVNSANLTWTSSIIGTLRIIDGGDKNRILFEKKTVIAPAVIETKNTAGFTIDRNAAVDLAGFRAQADEFAGQSRIDIRTELVISLDVLTQVGLASGFESISDHPALVVPLTPDTFQITEDLSALGREKIWRWLPFQVVMAPFPFFWYPLTGVVFITGLILWLSLTKTRRKDKFERQLARMRRMARGQLMLISDKAWEPEWCITATDYRTMVKTARKLKHPIFCHVDRTGETPTAYFYVYYGENNYCLTFPEAKPAQGLLPPLSDSHEFDGLRDTPFSDDINPEE